jgi:hypothetical protein
MIVRYLNHSRQTMPWINNFGSVYDAVILVNSEASEL